MLCSVTNQLQTKEPNIHPGLGYIKKVIPLNRQVFNRFLAKLRQGRAGWGQFTLAQLGRLFSTKKNIFLVNGRPSTKTLEGAEVGKGRHV